MVDNRKETRTHMYSLSEPMGVHCYRRRCHDHWHCHCYLRQSQYLSCHRSDRLLSLILVVLVVFRSGKVEKSFGQGNCTDNGFLGLRMEHSSRLVLDKLEPG